MAAVAALAALLLYALGMTILSDHHVEYCVIHHSAWTERSGRVEDYDLIGVRAWDSDVVMGRFKTFAEAADAERRVCPRYDP